MVLNPVVSNIAYIVCIMTGILSQTYAIRHMALPAYNSNSSDPFFLISKHEYARGVPEVLHRNFN